MSTSESTNKSAPRVTPADIEANIVGCYYFTAQDGVTMHSDQDVVPNDHDRELGLVTFCVLILRNGTKIVGINYGPISPENFDAEMGRSEARAHAIDQVWPLMGYQLREQFYRGVRLAKLAELSEADMEAILESARDSVIMVGEPASPHALRTLNKAELFTLATDALGYGALNTSDLELTSGIINSALRKFCEVNGLPFDFSDSGD